MDAAKSEEKRKPGRPELPDHLKRPHVVSVRLTDNGLKKVRELAAAKEMSVPEYVRLALKMLAEGTLLIR